MDGLLKVPEVAARLRVSEATVRRLVGDRSIDHIRVGGSIRFEESAIERYLNGNRVVAVRVSDPPVAAAPDDEYLRGLGIKHGLIKP